MAQATGSTPPSGKTPENITENMEVSSLDMLMSLSTALDLVDPRLGDHHKLTSYIAARIAKALGTPEADYNRLFAAALVHDIGATPLSDRLRLMDFEENAPHDHARLGFMLLDSIDMLSPEATVVRDHHVRWADGAGREYDGHDVDPLSHIIHCADRIAIQVDRDTPVLLQAARIRERIVEHAGKLFSPEIATAFADLSQDHGFWLQMDGTFLDDSLAEVSRLTDMELDINDLTQLAQVYAFIIDSRSRFTASHSSGVATVAETLALAAGCDLITAQKMRIAGYLHDIGKIAIPNEYLDKNGALSDEERLVMKGHSFYTKKILGQVAGIEKIAEWASQHHEFLDGSGYPFGLKGDQLDLEARILTIADIFTALTEDRPYRQGMTLSECLNVLEKLANDGKVDGNIFAVLADNADAVNDIRSHAQEIENVRLAEFWKRVSAVSDWPH